MTERLEMIRMWDGKDYARDKIEQLSRRTAEYAETHKELVETIEFDEQAAWNFNRRCLAWAAVVMAVILGIVCVTERDVTLGKIAVAAGLLAVCIGFTAGMIALVGIPNYRCHFPIVTSLRDGTLQVRTPDTDRSVALHAIEWKYCVPARERSALKYHPCKQAILLSWPPGSKWFSWSRECAVCGLTEDMREHWATVLTLARVPNRNRKPPAVPRTRTQR